MLTFDPRRVFRLRGITNDLTFMIRNGFVRSTASKLLNRQARYVKDEHLEKLCLLLHCTPNDLFEWEPQPNSPAAEDHPLRALKRGEAPKNIAELVKEIPLEKLDRVESLLDQLKNGE